MAVSRGVPPIVIPRHVQPGIRGQGPRAGRGRKGAGRRGESRGGGCAIVHGAMSHGSALIGRAERPRRIDRTNRRPMAPAACRSARATALPMARRARRPSRRIAGKAPRAPGPKYRASAPRKRSTSRSVLSDRNLRTSPASRERPPPRPSSFIGADSRSCCARCASTLRLLRRHTTNANALPDCEGRRTHTEARTGAPRCARVPPQGPKRRTPLRAQRAPPPAPARQPRHRSATMLTPAGRPRAIARTTLRRGRGSRAPRLAPRHCPCRGRVTARARRSRDRPQRRGGTGGAPRRPLVPVPRHRRRERPVARPPLEGFARMTCRHRDQIAFVAGALVYGLHALSWRGRRGSRQYPRTSL